jgi:hypothetical protein
MLHRGEVGRWDRDAAQRQRANHRARQRPDERVVVARARNRAQSASSAAAAEQRCERADRTAGGAPEQRAGIAI